MASTLSALFDFQKFEGNAELQRVIDSVHTRYAKRELTMEELEWVNAAGSADRVPEKKDPEKGNQ